MQLTRIVAAVVDTTKAILYKTDGTTLEILQGDNRLRPILEYITPLLTNQGYADIDLSIPNSWKEFEEKSTGGFKFFSIAKEKLKGLFGSGNEPVSTMVVGILPSAKMSNAVAEILSNAVSVSHANFEETNVAPQRPVVEAGGHTPNDRRENEGREQHFDKHQDTIVAVTPSGTVVPGVERIKSQFAAAAKNSSTKGLEVFLTRLGKVIQKRSHTVEDLLRFMERGDLPVADDGTILIYKKLTRINAKGEYVDTHSRKVRQRVGSYVFMNENLVDLNRRNECSNGLHVARRGYIKTFGGDVIVLAKVRPEDVIAVPDYDANKMRVCGYHIIAELTPAQFQAINTNRPISDAEGGAELLGNAIAGNHVAIRENVQINGHSGTDLKVTSVKDPENSGVRLTKRQKKAKKKAIKKKPRAAKPVKPLESNQASSDKPVSVKQVVARQKDSKASLMTDLPKATFTQADEVQTLWNAALGGDKAKAQELLDFKKSKKKGWAVWGLDPSAGDTLKALIKGLPRYP